MQATAQFSIGKLAQQTGCNIETIRYYERIKLLPKPARSAGGHRLYSQAQLQRLNFIYRCRKLGFTLNEVQSLLTLVDGGDYTCAEVQAITLQHLAEVRHKIEDLQVMEKTLTTMVSACEGGATPDCPVIETLKR